MTTNVPDTKITSAKQFVHWSDELTDEESVAAVREIAKIQQKWAAKTNTKENLEMLRDEVLTKMMELNIVAEFDPSPCFYGEPPILEIRGKVQGDPIHQYGFDHEKKQWEVRKAAERGEEFLGQRESNKSKKSSGA